MKTHFMMSVKATIEFGSFFSYRIPDFSSQYALSSLLPSPLAIKLGLVSTAIQYKGKDFGKKIFEMIKSKEIGFKVKGRIISNNFLIKRLKAKKGGGGLGPTFGIRGYIFFENPLEIWILNVSEEILEVLKRLRYLGTSDSICSIIEVEPKEKVPSKLVFARKELNQKLKNSLIIPTKDLSSRDTFEKVDIYTKKKPILEKKFFQIPVKSIEQGKNWTVYEIGE
ncbi:CRISPR-associated protein Cas5 [Candidatus Parcubacteria bacterium]|nr:CRISPR-associated protein Cas5 [Candidatus Parcubacteria bacterium]